MEVSEENLRAHAKYLSASALQGREFNTEGNRLAVQYIKKHFREYGLEAPALYPNYVQSLPEGGQNVLGILQGSDHELSKQCVIVDAHHDHMGDGFVGASDNAAGVSVLLELARIFAEHEYSKRSLLFACFDAEEQLLDIGGRRQIMYGASYYVRNPIFDLKKTVSMITLDTLGRTGLIDNLIFILGSERSLFIQDVLYECKTDLRKILFSVDMLTGIKGNYIPFLEKRVPCLFVSNGIHEDYHTRNDTEDKLQYELLTKDTKFTIELLSKISCSPERPDFCKNPICPKTEVEDILYLLKSLQELSLKYGGYAERFNLIIGKLESGPSKKDLTQAVQIVLGFMTPNFARLYLMLNEAQMSEKRKEYRMALQHYEEIVALYDQYRVPYIWIREIEDKIAKLKEKLS
ncbi:MAG: M28 family peptidase [Nitrososphaerales archaeon]